MTKVKICGLSTPEAVATAVEAGADYIGFVFAKSKRQVSLEQAHELAKGVTGQTKIVGVFVSPSLEELEESGTIFVFPMKKDTYLWHRDSEFAVRQKIEETLQKYHSEHPYRYGMKKAEIHNTFLKKIKPNIFDAALTLSDVDDEKKLECNNVIVEWLERTAESPNEKVRISSIFMLAAKYIQMEKYKEANIFLDKIPDTVIDATIMKTNVLAHQEGTDIAAFFLEGKLMQTVTNIQNYLYKLIEMEEETGNHCKAEEIAEITEHMISLFGLWDYGKVVPHLLIAGYRKDVEKCIQLIKEVLMESQKPWKMVESPLYYRYADTVQGKSFSGVGNNFVRALAAEIENKEEYEFLKGNKELEAIFAQYLK